MEWSRYRNENERGLEIYTSLRDSTKREDAEMKKEKRRAERGTEEGLGGGRGQRLISGHVDHADPARLHDTGV